MYIWAHRGSHHRAGPLENTLPAFLLAIEESADGIELDVHLSSDGVPVVFHDETLERLVIGRDERRIESLSLSEIQRVELLRGHRIPSLREALEIVDGRLPVNIEIKDAKAVEAVADILWSEQRSECLISSFSAAAVEHAASCLPNHVRAWISGEARVTEEITQRLERPFETLSSCHAHRWHTDALAVHSANLGRAKELGIEVHVWTINDPLEARRLRDLGVDGVFTDHPARLREALQ